MPTNNDLPEPLEWNEENFDRVLSELYQEIETDESLRQRFMTEPFDVLSGRIAIPEKFRGGIFVTERGQDTMMLYAPARAASAREALPEGTSDASPQRNYQVLCTPDPIW